MQLLTVIVNFIKSFFSNINKTQNKQPSQPSQVSQPSQEPQAGQNMEVKNQNKLEKLTDEQMNKIKAALGYKESRNNYKIVNTLGYMGKYQFGVPALVDRGLIDYDKFKKYPQKSKWQIAFADDDSNWINCSKEIFLNTPSLQELIMDKHLRANEKYLLKYCKTTEELAGAVAAAHLGGPGGARDLIVKGEGFKDAYGTDIVEYYNLGVNAINS